MRERESDWLLDRVRSRPIFVFLRASMNVPALRHLISSDRLISCSSKMTIIEMMEASLSGSGISKANISHINTHIHIQTTKPNCALTGRPVPVWLLQKI